MSNIGSWFRTIAIIAFIYEMTGSALAVGISFIIRFIPRVIMTVISGSFIDQIPKKFVLVYANYAASFIGLVIFGLLSIGINNINVFYFFILLISLADAIYQPARLSAIPEVVEDKDYYGKAAAYMKISRELTMVFSTAIGGLIIGLVGTNIIFLIDACTYLVAGIIQHTIKLQKKVVKNKETLKLIIKRSLNQFSEGIRLSSKNKSVQLVTAIYSIRQFSYGIANIAFALIIYDKFRLGDNFLAWSYMVGGIGAMIGGYIVHKSIKSHLERHESVVKYVITANSLNAVLLAAMFFSPSIWIFLIFVLVHDIAMLCTEVVLEGSILTFVPKDLIGRASSYFMSIGEISFLLGSIIYTFFINSWSFEVLGGLLLLIMLGGTLLIASLAKKQYTIENIIEEKVLEGGGRNEGT